MTSQRAQTVGAFRRFGYGDSITSFLAATAEEVVGHLTARSSFNIDQSQVDAWLGSIDVLRAALTPFGGRGHLFLEFDIPRMGRRVDALLVLDHVVFVIEFKVGAKVFSGADLDQVMDYALDLKNFHEPSHLIPLVPVLVSTHAPAGHLCLVTDREADGLYAPGMQVATHERTLQGNVLWIFPFPRWSKKMKRTIVNRTYAVAGGARSVSPVRSVFESEEASQARFLPALFISTITIFAVLATVPVQAAGPIPVILGTAGNFAVLAKTAISTTGATNITGDIGVSPATADSIVGFMLVPDALGQFSTSLFVSGRVFAADYQPPTPTNMATAVGDMETAYINAAGRLSPNFTNIYGGNLTGQTLAPGLYKWTTGVLVSAGGVVVSGGPNDVWIFQIAQDFTLASGAAVTLAGGASAANIFWQVAGQTILGAGAAMKGVILSQNQIAMGSGAALAGRALGQSAVMLDGNSVTAVDASLIFANGFD